MTIPADAQTNERKFRFKDEWLVSLVGTMPGVTTELITRWRTQEKPYVAQALIDGIAASKGRGLARLLPALAIYMVGEEMAA